jgi:hypothetical protein
VVYDPKVINPNAKADQETRTPTEWLNFIAEKAGKGRRYWNGCRSCDWRIPPGNPPSITDFHQIIIKGGHDPGFKLKIKITLKPPLLCTNFANLTCSPPAH